MSSTEQVIQKTCPATAKVVDIRIVYAINFTGLCPISIVEEYIECAISDGCPAYQLKNPRCLLWGNLGLGLYGEDKI